MDIVLRIALQANLECFPATWSRKFLIALHEIRTTKCLPEVMYRPNGVETQSYPSLNLYKVSEVFVRPVASISENVFVNVPLLSRPNLMAADSPSGRTHRNQCVENMVGNETVRGMPEIHHHSPSAP